MNASKKKAKPDNPNEFRDEVGHLWRQGYLDFVKSPDTTFWIPPVQDKRSLVAAIRRVRNGAAHLYRVSGEMEVLVREGVMFPDLSAVLGIPTPEYCLPPPRGKWKLRQGSDAAVMHELLLAAGRAGLSEDEVVEQLRFGRSPNDGERRTPFRTLGLDEHRKTCRDYRAEFDR